MPAKLVSLDQNYLTKSDFFETAISVGLAANEIKYYHNRPVDRREIIFRATDAEILSSTIQVKYDAELIRQLPKLKAIMSNTVGVNHIDLHAAKARGIKVFNCHGYNAQSVAEFSFSILISLLRKIPAAAAHVKAGGYSYQLFQGIELSGKTFGIIGAGEIGSRLLEIARGFSMDVLVHTLNPSQIRAKNLGIDKFSSLRELLIESDVIVLALPLTSTTKGLIGKHEFKLMKQTSVLINVARQTIVDEKALSDALINKEIAGAGLDMLLSDPFDINDHELAIQELVNLPNVIVTPHIGAETVEAQARLIKYFKNNLEKYLAGDYSPSLV